MGADDMKTMSQPVTIHFTSLFYLRCPLHLLFFSSSLLPNLILLHCHSQNRMSGIRIEDS